MVLNNAVMNNRYPVIRRVGVSIGGRGFAMRRPAGVGNADDALGRLSIAACLEFSDFSNFTDANQRSAFTQTKPGRIIASVFQSF
jgi:hypothetical protein